MKAGSSTAGASPVPAFRRAEPGQEGSSSTNANGSRGHAVNRNRAGRLVLLASLLAVLAWCSDASSRVIGSTRDVPANRLDLEVQSDPVFLLEMGYGRAWPERHALVLEASLSVPMLTLDRLDDFELSAGASAELWRRGGWGLRAGLFGGVAYTANANGEFTALGLEAAAAPGYFAPRWFIALDLRLRVTLASHLAHSDRVRDTFDDRYPEGTPLEGRVEGPEDGWVAFPATRVVAGLAGGYTIRRRITLYGAGGLDVIPTAGGVFLGGGVGVIPFYGIAGAAVHF